MNNYILIISLIIILQTFKNHSFKISKNLSNLNIVRISLKDLKIRQNNEVLYSITEAEEKNKNII